MHPHRQLPRLFRSPTSETVPRAKNRLAITPTTEREIAAQQATCTVLTSSVIAIAADEAAMLLLFMLTLTANSAQHLTQPRFVSAERTTFSRHGVTVPCCCARAQTPPMAHARGIATSILAAIGTGIGRVGHTRCMYTRTHARGNIDDV